LTPTPRLDLAGQRFSRLTVLRPGESLRTPYGRLHTTWICECDCKNQVQIRTQSLRSGATRSCGCLSSEISRKNMPLHRCPDRWGPDNPKWNPKLTPEERKLERGAHKSEGAIKNFNSWSDLVKRRAGFVCSLCEATKTYIEAHHMNNWRDFPAQRLNLGNGVALCHRCHKAYHGRLRELKKSATRIHFELYSLFWVWSLLLNLENKE